MDLDLNGKRPGATSDGNFSSHLIGTSWYLQPLHQTNLFEICAKMICEKFGNRKETEQVFAKLYLWRLSDFKFPA